MENPWKTKNSKIVYETPWMKIREDEVVRPDGTDGKYSYLETKDSAYIVALTEKEEIYLVGQWRYATKTYSWEIPGGGGDGGDVLETAKRELKEETGLEAEDWVEVGKLEPMNGVISEIEHVFIAKDLKQTEQDKKIEDGIDQVKTVTISEFEKMVGSGEITDAQSIAAFTQAKLFLEKDKG